MDKNLLKNAVVSLRFQVNLENDSIYVAAEPGKGDADEPVALQAILVLIDILKTSGLPHQVFERNTAKRGVDAPDAIVISPMPPLPRFLEAIAEGQEE